MILSCHIHKKVTAIIRHIPFYHIWKTADWAFPLLHQSRTGSKVWANLHRLGHDCLGVQFASTGIGIIHNADNNNRNSGGVSCIVAPLKCFMSKTDMYSVFKQLRPKKTNLFSLCERICCNKSVCSAMSVNILCGKQKPTGGIIKIFVIGMPVKNVIHVSVLIVITITSAFVRRIANDVCFRSARTYGVPRYASRIGGYNAVAKKDIYIRLDGGQRCLFAL